MVRSLRHILARSRRLESTRTAKRCRLARAIEDALAHFGVRFDRVPVTRIDVWAAVQGRLASPGVNLLVGALLQRYPMSDVDTRGPSGESDAVDSETRDAFERLERNLRGEIQTQVAGVEQSLREEISTRVGGVERSLREEIQTQVAGVEQSLREEISTRVGGVERSLREEIQTQVAGVEQSLREEISTRVGGAERNLREEIQTVQTQVGEVRSHVDARLVETRDALETRIVESEERTRRHFDVVAEALRGDIRVLAEGITAVAEGSMRRDTETNGRVDRLEHRVLGLESRVSHLEGPRPPRRRRR
jgi:hypothetical protein